VFLTGDAGPGGVVYRYIRGTMAKWLVIVGIVFVVIGLVWPWLSRLGIGHLPGDIYIERKGFNFYFPLTSSVIVSLVLSFLFWIFRK
jgi:Protein of unknown function (DUF2905)